MEKVVKYIGILITFVVFIGGLYATSAKTATQLQYLNEQISDIRVKIDAINEVKTDLKVLEQRVKTLELKG